MCDAKLKISELILQSKTRFNLSQKLALKHNSLSISFSKLKQTLANTLKHPKIHGLENIQEGVLIGDYKCKELYQFFYLLKIHR